MSDNLTKEQRKKAMSRVRQQDTKPEKIVRSLLHRLGFRFRKNVSSIVGKPDIVLPKYKTVIFVHGCFWHQHKNCRKSARPISNADFWNTKLDKNVERDKKIAQLLKKAGWKIITVWECELKHMEKLEKKLLRNLLDNRKQENVKEIV